MALLRALGACAAACAAGLGAFLTLGGGDRPAAPLTAERVAVPLAFEPNAGRFRGGADYVANDSGAKLAVGPTGSRVAVAGGALTTRLVGATAPRARAEDRLPTRVNWYASSDRSRWRTGLPTFGRVRYGGVYPGVDLVYHGRRGALEYDFVVAPGADPSRIAMRLAGARSLRLAENGDLVARVGSGAIRQMRPVAYQRIAGERRPVEARFVLAGNQVRFSVGAHDRSAALVIDPVLAFSDYVGGSASDASYDVAVDASGNSIVAGASGTTGTVTKIQPGGSREWVTTLGSVAEGVAVDPNGNVFVTGRTGDTLGAAAGTYGGGANDAFVARLDGDGSSNWAKYFGGTGSDVGNSIAVDGAGNTYVAGDTPSAGLATAGAYDESVNTGTAGASDAFVAKFNAAGTRQFSTYLGGSSSDGGEGVAIAPGCPSDCDVYVTGYSWGGFPVSPGAQDTAITGASVQDAFIFKLGATGATRIWASYFGGDQGDSGYSVAVSPLGRASIVGGTDSYGNGGEAYIHTFRSGDGGPADPMLRFGGSADEDANDVAYDSQGNAYVTGLTLSANFDTTAAVQPDKAGSQDAFAVKFRPGTVFPVWSTYLGGADFDTGEGVAVDATGGAHLVGSTSSVDFPTVGATTGDQTGTDGYLSRIFIKPAVIDSGPSGTVRARNASFTYSSGESGATYTCRLAPVEASFSACPSIGKTYEQLADGDYTFEVATVDGGGTPGQVTSRAFTINTQPLASLVVAPNPVLVGRPVTFDAGASSVADQPITKFEWDLDGDGVFETDTGTTATTSAVYAAPKTIQVGLRITDGDGTQGTTATELRVTTQPGVTQFGVTVNKGAQYTKSPDVTVSAVFPATTTSMLFSNDGGFLAPATFLPAPSVKWKLDSSGPERLPKTIYVRFLAGAIVGETFQDDIILDETPPVVQQAAVSPAAAAAAARVATSSRLRRWRLRVRARDSNSGVARIQATSNKRKPGKLHRYKRRLTVRSAKRPRWIRARDRAGNYSKWRRAR